MNRLKKNKQLQAIALKVIRFKNAWLFKKQALQTFQSENTTLTLEEVTAYQQSRLFGYQPYICNAPFNSLYFENRGRVMACCMSGNYVLGDINQQSLKEIWDGEAAQILRADIAQYNLKKACLKCEHAIKAGAFHSAMSSEYDSISVSKIIPFPQRMDFELHNTCNLACIMCNSRNSSSYAKKFHPDEPALPMSYGKAFLEELDTFIPHLKKANFLGGEPFLMDVYYEIWDKLLAHNPNCNIFIQTNGHIFNQKIKNMLAKGKFSIGISFESLNKNVFNSIRLNGNFDKLMENIANFKMYCQNQGTHLSFAITPLRKTVLELADFVSFANQHQAEIFFNVATEPHDLAIWSMESTAIQQILEDLKTKHLPNATNTIEQTNVQQFHSYVQQIGNWHQEAAKREIAIQQLENVSNEELIQIILANMQTLLADSMQYNQLYHAEYLAEMEEMKQTLQQMNNEHYRPKLKFLAVIDAERSSSEIAKKPLNKMEHMIGNIK
jgi:radical SAM protein with 4Fe4S-binding SPASM domain